MTAGDATAAVMLAAVAAINDGSVHKNRRRKAEKLNSRKAEKQKSCKAE